MPITAGRPRRSASVRAGTRRLIASRATTAATIMRKATAPLREPSSSRPSTATAAVDGPDDPRALGVAPPVARASSPRSGRSDQGGGPGHHEDDTEEDPPPAQRVRDVRRKRRAEERRQHPGRREAGEHRRLQAGGEDQADQDVQAHGQGTAAQTLEDPAGDEHLHRGRQAADHESGGEEDEGRARGTRGPRRSLQPPAATMPTTPLASGAAKAARTARRRRARRATVGMTVVTAVASKATKAQSANMPIVVATYVGDSRRGWVSGGACSGGAVKVTA